MLIATDASLVEMQPNFAFVTAFKNTIKQRNLAKVSFKITELHFYEEMVLKVNLTYTYLVIAYDEFNKIITASFL